MNKTAWRRVFAYLGIALFGFVLAYYATAIGTAGIAAGLLGRTSAGTDLLSAGSAALLVGVAMYAVFGYLALKLAWSLLRERR